jgi:hypothetical protein
VKNRFQNLPFKCNLQHYNADLDDLEVAGLDSLGSAALRQELVSRLGDTDAADAALPANLLDQHSTLGALIALVAGVLVNARGGEMIGRGRKTPPPLPPPPPPPPVPLPPLPPARQGTPIIAPVPPAPSDDKSPPPKPVSTEPEPESVSPRRRLRVLCLHGTATNAEVLRRQMAQTGWLRALDAASAECVFLDGPIPANHLGGADADAMNAVLGKDAYPPSAGLYKFNAVDP